MRRLGIRSQLIALDGTVVAVAAVSQEEDEHGAAVLHAVHLSAVPELDCLFSDDVVTGMPTEQQ